jgi:hypothetical protein
MRLIFQLEWKELKKVNNGLRYSLGFKRTNRLFQVFQSICISRISVDEERLTGMSFPSFAFFSRKDSAVPDMSILILSEFIKVFCDNYWLTYKYTSNYCNIVVNIFSHNDTVNNLSGVVIMFTLFNSQ